MRSLLSLHILLLLVFADANGALATIDVFSLCGQPVSLSVIAQNREEVWNWFTPTNQPDMPAYENRYNFLGSWIRAGIGYRFRGVGFFGELMSPYFFNLPNNAVAPAPQGALGLGANYFQANGDSTDANVFLKQGYLEFGRALIEGLHIRGGRFEFFDGLEYSPDGLDPDLKWLVASRIAKRLIGNFAFSDVMRSFDGATAAYGNEKWQATVMYGTPTKGLFDLNAMGEVRDVDVAYASLNVGPSMFSSRLWGSSLGRLFYIYYNDSRGLPLVDNRNLSGAQADTGPVSIDTIGADYVRIVNAGPGAFDFVTWAAGQFGAWGSLSQRSYAVVAEGGYRLMRVPWRPWLRAGYTVGSGDNNPHDSIHQTFFQILPTPQLYAKTPFYNMMNLDDAMGQLVLDPFPRLRTLISAHGLWLDSTSDLWYSDGGAYNNKSFGFVGRPSFGHSSLATVLDCQVTWTINNHMSARVYYAHAFGGNIIGSIYPLGREADFGFIQMTWTL